MSLTGQNLIAGQYSGDIEQGFTAFNAFTGEPMSTTFADATSSEVETAITRAHEAFCSYSQLDAPMRARFLRTIGEQILALGDELVEIASTETGLPHMRIKASVDAPLGN